MKHKFARLLSLLLTVALVGQLLPMAAFAAETSHTYTYLSMGDSTSNGYMMADYNFDDCGLGSNASRSCYPYKIYHDLKAEHGEVKFYQYCLAGMRTNELRALLEDDFSKNADGSWKSYDVNGGYDYFCQSHIKSFADAFHNKLGKDDISAAFRKAVTNADLISIDLSMNSFGTYLSDRLQVNGGLWDREARGIPADAFRETMDGVREELDALYPDAYDAINQLFRENMARLGYMVEGPEDVLYPEDDVYVLLMDTMVGMSYGFASYLINFNACMEDIYTMNPDVDVLVVGPFNSMDGIVGQFQGVDGGTYCADLGKVWEATLGMVSDFLQGELSFAPNKFAAAPDRYGYHFVDSEENGVLPIFYDEVASCVDDEGNYKNTMTRGTLHAMVKGIYGELIADFGAEEVLTNAFLDGIAAMADEQFGALGIKGAGKAFAQNVRTHFGIDGVNKTAFTTEDILNAYDELPDNMSMIRVAAQGLASMLGCYHEELANYCLVNAFEQVMGAFAKSTKLESMNLHSLLGLMLDMDTVGAKFSQALTDFEHADEGMKAFFYIFVRFTGMRGLGCHPNADGVEAKYQAVRKVLDQIEAAKAA